MKPKLPAQFKSAEQNGVPLAVILGEDELARGEVKLKEMGLPEEHPEKNGVTVAVENLANEVQKKLIQFKEASRLDEKRKDLSLQA